ncbi:MAG: TolC family protein [Bacteroidales bacterium]|nr:TolC family protein [Bacteroidales bacterium]
MHISKIAITSIALVLALGAYAQDTLRLSLDDCHQLALKNSQNIKIAEETINKASGEKIAARAAWLPKISANAYGLYSEQNFKKDIYLPTKVVDPSTGQLVPNILTNPSGNPVIGADGNPVFNTYAFLPIDITLQGGVLANISVQQPIFAGGRIIAGNKMASTGQIMANYNKQLQTTQLIYETDKAYYRYLSIRSKVRLAQKYQELLRQLVKTVSDAYETGMKNRNDLLKVQVKYNDAKLQLQKAQSGLLLSQMALCQTIGIPLNSPIAIDDSITINSSQFAIADSISVANRVEYKLLEDQVKMAKQNINLVRGQYLPSAGVSANYNRLEVGLKDMNNYSSNSFSLMGTIKIPLTAFGEGYGRVKSAKADYNIKQLELQKTKELLQLENEQARQNLINANTQVAMAREAVEQANENMRVTDDNYNVGMETIVNVLEAKLEWQKAYTSLIDALTELKVQQSNYNRITNKLTVDE